MKNIIIGTAGHIDHGKTALIHALNGFSGDETKEEKRRGITINLSFSNLSRADKNLAFIDVPGHENLVKTMISGAYGFDACILVIASDDGIMPQTKEHVNILNFLGVKKIIPVITKSDKRSQNELNDLENEVKNYLLNFENFEILKIFQVSAKTGKNIDDLRDFLFTLEGKIPKIDEIFKLYIDRIFNIKGAGTIITGTAISGEIKNGEKIYNLQNKEFYQIRNIEIHSKSSDTATAGNRVALNLSGKTGKLEIGQILSKKGFFRGFKNLDAKIKGDLPKNAIFCIGSKQCEVKILPLEGEFYTLKFKEEIFSSFKEKFLLLSNGRLVGGGEILNPVSEPMKKNLKIELLDLLDKDDFLSAFELLSKFHKHGFGLISSYQRFGMKISQSLQIAKNLKGVFVDEEGACVYGDAAFNDVKEFILNLLEKNEKAIFSATSLNLKIAYANLDFIKIILDELEENKIIQKDGKIYFKFGQNPANLKNAAFEKIYEIIKNAGITPEAPYNIYDELQIDREVGDEVLKQLTKAKKIVRLQHNLFVESGALNLALNKLREIIKNEGKVNITNLKENLKVSRKFGLAYLEYLDKFDDIKKDGVDRLFV